VASRKNAGQAVADFGIPASAAGPTLPALTPPPSPSTVGAVPQKRDPSLIPLSHDHHQGLVRVFEIRQALRSGNGLERQAEVTRAFYARDLLPHFRAEEEVLVPVLRQTGAVDEAALQRLLDEHRTLARLASEVAGAPAAEPLQHFADLLERHIRTEEREIFAAYQAHVPVGRRDAVAAEVRRILKRPHDQATGDAFR
jgi:hemerythrin-like domain-containing protein